jgi:hypothetical protein
LRIKTTRENAAFLANGLVKKLFQVASGLNEHRLIVLSVIDSSAQLQQALRHISIALSYAGKLRRLGALAAIENMNSGF